MAQRKMYIRMKVSIIVEFKVDTNLTMQELTDNLQMIYLGSKDEAEVMYFDIVDFDVTHST